MPAADHLRLDEQFCFAVYSTAHALNRVYKPRLDAIGVTYPQYLVLLVLWQDDGLTVGAIGERLGLESSTLTPLLKRLEGAGLIARARSREDERQVIVSLTDSGRNLREKARRIPLDMLAATGLEATALGRLRDALVGVRESLADTAEEEAA
ncbi:MULTISPECIES: MarR family winged helix-turn-helix transcriptional regulator [Sphingomonadales]|uniref:MarR family transcriptional regulator n=2 Tax=Edaphosphingomonas TaxID=3423724 RepID=A0A2T4HP64_9SPHN|nr:MULTISPECIES: MarR family transcriptional regulator [Sphingomonas]AGH49306.1 transcriptional regulator [Sphingomonas sp. MM-1]MDX3885905.1 MarR family transcriptional regulator [Sphingomonas sp.]OHT21943.1 Organic hydroperoxide resistance transcriptional regulator [Sphingomonas haloaromaticamans]PTD17570.1 MarR family transcriptional regulator [Sphingomonas fennica]